MAAQDEDGMEASSFASPMNEQHQETSPPAQEAVTQLQHHHLASINTTLLIRQIHSQGLAFQIWPAANSLVSLLEHHHQNPNNNPLSSILSTSTPLRILELGSGTGLVGIAAAALLQAKVTITDLPHVLPNLVFNAKANQTINGRVEVGSLRWGEEEDMEAIGRDFDVILGSDVVYHDHLYEPLLQTLQFFLGEESETVFVMAHLKRWKKESSFFKKARKMFRVETLHSDPPLAGARVGVMVYSFARKSAKQ